MSIFSKNREVRVGRSAFNLSYSKLLTMDMGQLIPIMCDEVVPGDVFDIGNEMVIRFQPLVAPVLHPISAYVHYFFVPYRLLWDSWENFITGGIDGQDVSVLPVWNPTTYSEGSLWDYLGFPAGVKPTNCYPMQFPLNAYNLVFNQYYRDETLDTEVALTDEAIKFRRWRKDYFTSALPWQQRGTAPALPISGSVSASFTGAVPQWLRVYVGKVVDNNHALKANAASGDANVQVQRVATTGAFNDAEVDALVDSAFKTWLNSNSIDLSGASTFNVADLRLAFQIQRWMERNARGGARYTESLRAHFGISPRDERLQRAEYIGGSKSNIIVSEVLKTSTDGTTPQGTMAGHGLAASVNYISKYHVQEYGLILGVLSVMPEAMYQQGINRQWLRKTKYDFYWPEFANLSEQAITQEEIYASGVEAENKVIWGYQGRYSEMRYKPNMVAGQMRSTFDYWHLGRKFTSAPNLNSSFVQFDGTQATYKRIFAAPSVPSLYRDW